MTPLESTTKAAKIMLVEDDTNLSEIYQARLEAEGYTIVSAKDGEEALALAVKERPDLIICDVMMPKISGFDMLDIMRGTEGIQDTKVIVMTALGQAEDKTRADKLGADRYLVKSQVTLEDVIKAVHDVLEGDSTQQSPSAATPAPTTTPTTQTPPVPTTAPITAATTPTVTPIAVQPMSLTAQTAAAAPQTISATATPSTPAPTTPPATTPTIAAPSTTPQNTPSTPISSPTVPLKEVNEEIAIDEKGNLTSVEQEAKQDSTTTQSEESTVQNQINSFANPTPAPTPPTPETSTDTTPSTPEPQQIASVTSATGTTSTVVPVEPVKSNETADAQSTASIENQNYIAGKKMIQPLNDLSKKPDIQALLAAEEQQPTGDSTVPSRQTTFNQEPSEQASSTAQGPGSSPPTDIAI